MNFKLLDTYIAVVEKRNFSRAAYDLHLTQPAVTKHIQALEENFNTQLVNRSGRKVKITAAGDILYRYAAQIRDLLEQAEKEMLEAAGADRGQLLIGASSIPGQYILPRLIGAFRQDFPEINITLEIADTEEIVGRLLDETINAGVVGAWVENPRITASRMTTDRLVLVIPPGHELAQVDDIRAADLVKYPFLIREQGSGSRRIFEERLQQAGVNAGRLIISMELDSTEAIVTAVEAGLGMAVISRWAAQKAAELGRIIIKDLTDLDLNRELYFIYRKSADQPRAMERFLEFIIRHQADPIYNIM